ncbi:MAG TPA: glycosyltransferase family 39 protein [Croceibacterium sp.]|nr:glycosyltransferase family 39 protein [Croceibacterium sp.]
MSAAYPPGHTRDPIGWTAALALGFLALALVRLTVPSKPFFDEVHYLPAARAMLALSQPLNTEHPPLGKELIALGIALFGDRPLGWRIMPALFGALGLFAAMRALWFASLSRFATIAFGVLLATTFPLFVQARIAMLDVFMAAFALLGLWMGAAALREHETARWRLAIAGAAMGCAMASKWNAIPIAVLPGLAFLAIRLRWAGRSFVTASRGAPIGGMTLVEAGVWLGLVPLAAYALSYWPFPLFEHNAVGPSGLPALQARMLALQEQVVEPHTYQSVWWQWAVNWRAIWYLYEVTDGAQRGVLLVGNPLTMLLGLPALAWCAWAGLARRRWDALAVATLYAASLALWIVAPKPVQFYYHYLLPSCFLMAALALALDALWRRGWRRLPPAVLAASCALFAFFWPILNAAALDGSDAFQRWTWLAGWV